MAPPSAVRVAIYTRKSTDDGLDREFTSLDNQRQAVEAYIESQRSNGWTALPASYDDGGFSGATTERPAFQRLLADVRGGRIDVVATYKLDRLARSLVDFVQTLRVFEEHRVEFVSVTEHFATTTPAGRLLMNLLASFAEFERQVISQRTADKMSASRRRGMWTGGRPVLGYDARDRRLVVNGEEAERVRGIFQLYLETGSLLATVGELGRRGWANKSWTTQEGHVVRGTPFTKATLSHLLRNCIYTGNVAHRGEVYPGAHEAIVGDELFEAVQRQLQAHTRDGGRETRNRWGALLKDLLKCGVCGSTMGHTFGAKRGRLYRYYVCHRVQSQGAAACPGSRVGAGAIEGLVVQHIQAIGRDDVVIAATVAAARTAREERLPEATAEHRRVRADRKQLEIERDNLLTAVSGGGAAVSSLVARLAEVDGRLAELVAREKQVVAEIGAIQTADIDEPGLRRALAEFGPLWDQLVPRERCQLLRLLVETVVFNAPADELTLRFRSAGIRALAQDAQGRSA